MEVKTKQSSSLQEKSEICRSCGVTTECAAEFNGEMVCPMCFEQMIRVSVGAGATRERGKNVKDFQDTNSSVNSLKKKPAQVMSKLPALNSV
jgi:predicted RNA-binding Zn-ribbon protein involved in translation (DUF1610 family)